MRVNMLHLIETTRGFWHKITLDQVPDVILHKIYDNN